ncbi:MAG: SDR family oxidoreductase [Tatlockia sp.]|nr:SDR family oxidoreductase [Tatlockia sp.]
MKTVLITGANRGLGLEFTRQLAEQNFDVIATCRQPSKADLLKQLAKAHANIAIVKLDVSSDSSIAKLINKLQGKPIDWLINNAGIMGEQGVTVGNIHRNNFLKVFDVNCLGSLKVSEALLPNLYNGEDKLIVVISSIMGNISPNQFGRSYAYRASKAALNCAMHALAMDIADMEMQILLLNPGWVKTDLGGPGAEIDAEDSVSGMLKVIDAKKADCHAEVMYDYKGGIVVW